MFSGDACFELETARLQGVDRNSIFSKSGLPGWREIRKTEVARVLWLKLLNVKIVEIYRCEREEKHGYQLEVRKAGK